MRLFPWQAARAARAEPDRGLIAWRPGQGEAVPAGAVLVIFDAAGGARRSMAARVKRAAGESAYCFHPGPYSVDLAPFAAAPELGLRLQFAIDAADPRVSQQRFDLYLFSEVAAQLRLEDFGAALQAALRVELAQGGMLLPPCATLDEWHAFRAGLNQLLYTRFGVTVEDCVPVDLGDTVDFAAQLAARAIPAAAAAPAPAPAGSAKEGVHKDGDDARALRRLFLELPHVSSALRLLDLPPGPELFHAQRALLQRLDLLNLAVCTMPSLGWATPDQRLDALQQARRARHSAAAVRALDEVWALLARLPPAGARMAQLLDEAERILSNLEHNLAMRRAPHPAQADEPWEPT